LNIHKQYIARLVSNKGTSTMLVQNKVASITMAFWVMKICATTVGETGGDLISMRLGVGYALSSLILVSFFIFTLILQLRSQRFSPWLYWAVILTTSTAGTTISDYTDRTLGLGYVAGSVMISGLLITVLALWKAKTGSLSVYHIIDRRTELFYWFAILASNTLGTALGDFLADSSGLGYAMSNLLIGGGIACILIIYWLSTVSRTLLFWIAFVLTRPFGATMGDLLTKSPESGGFGFGTIGASAVLLGALAILVMRDSDKNRLIEKNN
jgi:uncharacterized membrane-anchored protein